MSGNLEDCHCLQDRDALDLASLSLGYVPVFSKVFTLLVSESLRSYNLIALFIWCFVIHVST